MTGKLLIVLAATILPLTASAQQQPNPAFLEKAVAALQAQRDQANNAHAGAEAQRALLADEVTRLKAEIEEMKKKLAAAGER